MRATKGSPLGRGWQNLGSVRRAFMVEQEPVFFRRGVDMVARAEFVAGDFQLFKPRCWGIFNHNVNQSFVWLHFSCRHHLRLFDRLQTTESVSLLFALSPWAIPRPSSFAAQYELPRFYKFA